MLVEPKQEELIQGLRSRWKELLQEIGSFIVEGPIEDFFSRYNLVDNNIFVLNLEDLQWVAWDTVDAKFQPIKVHLKKSWQVPKRFLIYQVFLGNDTVYFQEYDCNLSREAQGILRKSFGLRLFTVQVAHHTAPQFLMAGFSYSCSRFRRLCWILHIPFHELRGREYVLYQPIEILLEVLIISFRVDHYLLFILLTLFMLYL